MLVHSVSRFMQRIGKKRTRLQFQHPNFVCFDALQGNICAYTSIKYKVERDERYLPYIELGHWLCSHFQLETPLNFHKPISRKLYNLEK